MSFLVRHIYLCHSLGLVLGILLPNRSRQRIGGPWDVRQTEWHALDAGMPGQSSRMAPSKALSPQRYGSRRGADHAGRAIAFVY
jgi:hypothetical protein